MKTTWVQLNNASINKREGDVFRFTKNPTLVGIKINGTSGWFTSFYLEIIME